MEGIKVGNKKSKYPIIQGGMGVGISMHNLAGNVSKEGGIGIISTANIGYQDADFNKKFYIIFKNFQFQSNLILCIIMT